MNKKSKILASFMIGSIAGGVAFAAEPVTDETLSDLIKKDKIITDMQKQIKWAVGKTDTNEADIIELKGKTGGIEENKKAIAENGESIIDIKYELNRMDASIEGAENDIEENASNIETNTTDITEMKGKIGGIETNKADITELKGKTGEIEENKKAIAENRRAIGSLGNRVSQIGASAAALAALRPLEFAGEGTWSVAGGYGHYNGENAGAVGVFYRPTENAMISVGAAFGGDDEMYNAGVSFRLGQGTSGASASNGAMAHELRMLQEKDAQRDAQMNRLMEKIQELEEELAAK